MCIIAVDINRIREVVLPELPEVETIRLQLDKAVTGRTITSVKVPDPLVLAPASSGSFRKHLLHRTIIRLSRRGKYLRFELDSTSTLVVHLRMTGRLTFTEQPIAPELKKYLRMVLLLDNGTSLAFNDARRFGKAFILSGPSENTYWDRLGPEPLERSFNATRLRTIVGNRNRPIKPLLMDQQMIAGIGNIYADEILFDAKIHPLRPASSLTDEDVRLLVKSIKKTLRSAISLKGSSIDTYRDAEGQRGGFQDKFKVHRRAGEPCPACGGVIQKIKVGGRGTYFCPACQRLS